KLGITMPITREVYAILFEDKPPATAIETLMARDLKFED
ncbi:MAG: glycerol-3-phosphate dehydrogenase, partial [Thermoprotei archaeon]